MSWKKVGVWVDTTHRHDLPKYSKMFGRKHKGEVVRCECGDKFIWWGWAWNWDWLTVGELYDRFGVSGHVDRSES